MDLGYNQGSPVPQHMDQDSFVTPCERKLSTWKTKTNFCRTSTGSCKLCPTNKTKVSSPSPKGLSSITKAQTSVEMIGLKGFIVIDGIVATGCVWTIYPNLY